MKRFGFIGVGELALYTIRGLRLGGYDEVIHLSPRNREKSALLASEYGCEVLADNQAVVDHCDCVIIATRPADCLETLAALEFKPGQLLISVVAGIETQSLRRAVPAAVEIARAMPVSSAEAGASPTLVYPDNALVCAFFDHCGNALAVEDETWFTQGSVLACVYSWFFELFENLIEVNSGERLPRAVCAELVMGMARGAAELALARGDKTPAEIADSIATDGTFSRIGLDLLQQRGAFDAWREASEVLQRRLAEDD